MHIRIGLVLILTLLVTGSNGQQPGARSIRIADTLTAQEKSNRQTVILRTELDSLINAYQLLHPSDVKSKLDPVILRSEMPASILMGLVIISLLLVVILVFVLHNRYRLKKILAEREASQVKATKEKTPRGKLSSQLLEAKISDLNAELYKLSKENEGLSRVIKEYNGIQQEYDSLKYGLQKVYKIKNYPGNDKNKDDNKAMQAVLDTESSVASYAYEKFLKPILGIVDANKNNPARLQAADRERLVDLLISLSLLYIECLYLRITDLSIGGKMVERIKGLSNHNGIDNALLRKLSTDHGSRALVIKMALEKTGVHQLSYPVFDETNLNN